MASSFQHYEVVKVVRPHPERQSLAGRLGVIVGTGREPGEPEVIGVLFDGLEMMESFSPEELESTGRILKREDVYDDRAAFKVVVDKDGRGRLK